MSVVIIPPKADHGPVPVPRKIETQRLILRPWKKNKADAKALYALAKDPKVGPSAGWPVHRDPAHSLQVIREVLATPDIYAVFLKKDLKDLTVENPAGTAGEAARRGGSDRPERVLVGAAGLTYGATGRKWLGEKEAEIGYWIGVPFWGHGYAPEAVRALLDRAFLDLGMEAVWGGYYEGNTRSARVLQKCGFVYHHTDAHSYCEALGETRMEHFMLFRNIHLLKHPLNDKSRRGVSGAGGERDDPVVRADGHVCFEQ